MATTASALPLTIMKASTIWPESILAQDFVPQIESLAVIKAQQSANVSMANLPEERDVKITWLNNCDIETEACDTDCDWSGTEADSSVQTLQIDRCVQTSFSEKIDPWLQGGNVNVFGFSDAVAVQLTKHMKIHAEAIAQYAVTKINANLGVNELTTMANWTVSSTDTAVAADQFGTSSVFGKFARTAQRNRFNNPYLLSGGTLWDLLYMSRTGAMNADGKGDANRIQTMPVYEDVFNLPTVNGDTEIVYMLNRGTMAFASRGWFSTTPVVMGGTTTRFQIRNRFDSSIVHDVESVEKCASGVWSLHYRIKTYYDFFINPTGCTATRTGLLKFTKEVGV